MFKSVKDIVLDLEGDMDEPTPIQTSPGDMLRNVPVFGMSEWRRIPWSRTKNTFILVSKTHEMKVKHCDLKYVQSTVEDGITWTLIHYQGRKQAWREDRYYLYRVVQDPADVSAHTYYLRAMRTMADYRKEWLVAGKQLLKRAPRDDEVVFRGQPATPHTQSALREFAQRMTDHESDSSDGRHPDGEAQSDENPAHLYENETTDSRAGPPNDQDEPRALVRTLSLEGQGLASSPLTRAATAAIHGFHEAASAQLHQAAAADPERQINEVTEQLNLANMRNEALRAELQEAQRHSANLKEQCRRMRKSNSIATQETAQLESLINRVKTLEDGIDRALQAQDDPGQDLAPSHPEILPRQQGRAARDPRPRHRRAHSSDSDSEYFRGRRRSPSVNDRGMWITSDPPFSNERANHTGARPKTRDPPRQISNPRSRDPAYQAEHIGRPDRMCDEQNIQLSTTPGRSPCRRPRTLRTTQHYTQPPLAQQTHTHHPYALPRPLTLGPQYSTAATGAQILNPPASTEVSMAADAPSQIRDRNLPQRPHSQNSIGNTGPYMTGQGEYAAQSDLTQRALLAVVENLTTLISQNTSNNAHNTANKFPKGFVTFYGGKTGVHIETFFQRAEAIMPTSMSDAEKICMIVANIDKNPDTQGIVQDNWTGTYAQFKEWLLQLYKDVLPETTISHWAQVSRKKYTKFNQWQSENTKLVNLTLNSWQHLGPAEKHLVMEGLANIAPKAALAKFKIGNRFSEELLRITPFMNILIHIGEHNENYEFTEWSCFDRTKLRQPAVQISSLESTNQSKDNNHKPFNRKRFQKNYQYSHQQNHRQNINQDRHYQQAHTEQNQHTQPKTQQQSHNPPQHAAGNSYTPRSRDQRSSFPRDPTGTCIHHGVGHRTDQCVTGITRAQAESQRGRGRGSYTNGRGVQNQTPGHNQSRPNPQPTSNPTQYNEHRGGRGNFRGNFRGRGRGYNNNRGRGGDGNRQINNLAEEGHLPLPNPELHTSPQQQNFQPPPQAQSTTLGIIQTNQTN